MIIKKQELVETSHCVCDFCENDSRKHRVKQCHFCNKHICSKCAIWQDLTSDLNIRNNSNDDYPDYICESCWDIGEPMRVQIQNIRNQAEFNEETLINSWKKACNQREE